MENTKPGVTRECWRGVSNALAIMGLAALLLTALLWLLT